MPVPVSQVLAFIPTIVDDLILTGNGSKFLNLLTLNTRRDGKWLEQEWPFGLCVSAHKAGRPSCDATKDHIVVAAELPLSPYSSDFESGWTLPRRVALIRPRLWCWLDEAEHDHGSVGNQEI